MEIVKEHLVMSEDKTTFKTHTFKVIETKSGHYFIYNEEDKEWDDISDEYFNECNKRMKDTFPNKYDNTGSRINKEKPTIRTYELNTTMGRSNIILPFLTEEEMEQLNSIGYSGKMLNGNEVNRVDYLNSLGIGEFTIRQTKYDDGEYNEIFTLTRYTNY